MELKTCSNCEHCLFKHCDYMCTRYPRWLDIHNPDFHWCGEWKEKENQEEADN